MSADRNRRTALRLAMLAAAMVGLSFAAVPLYRVFCRVTGFGGTTQLAAQIPAPEESAGNRVVTISLNADVAPGLPWEFAPEARRVALPIGEAATVKFRAKNISASPVIGTAVYNVQPEKSAVYFNKTECFCFIEQLLQPGEEKEFPVTFFLDPDMAKDRKLNDVTDITLSYTFFMAKDQKKKPAL